MAQALAFATIHDDIQFDQVAQVSVRAGLSPELPVYNYLAEQDLNAYIAWLDTTQLIKASLMIKVINSIC